MGAERGQIERRTYGAPGVPGGGPELTLARERGLAAFPSLGVRLWSSITTRFALRPGERTLADHYANNANEVLAERPQHAIFIGHSLGGIEVIKTIESVLRRDSSETEGIKRISLVMVSPFGFGEHQLLRSLLFLRVSHIEPIPLQHTVYPLPETYYKVPSQPTNPNANVFPDSQEARNERRAQFLEWLPTLEPNQKLRERLVDQLERLDDQIVEPGRSQHAVNKLLRQRARLLAPYMLKIFKGEMLPEEQHSEYMQMYQEFAPVFLAQFRSLLMTTGLFASLLRGNERRLEKIVKMAEQRGIAIDISLVFAERDLFVRERQGRRGFPISTFTAENMSHTSFGASPDWVYGIVKQLTESDSDTNF